jgi:cytochrome b561
MGTTSSVESREPAAAAPWRLRIIFWLDVTLLLSVCAFQDVPFTGLVIHEWLGLVMVGMVLAHLLFAWSWISSQSRRLLAPQSIRSRINYLLNLTLFACVVAVIFSGILISQRAVPALTGAKATSEVDWRWDRLHDQFSQALLLLSGLHLAINWEWVLAAGEKVFRRFGKSSL